MLTGNIGRTLPTLVHHNLIQRLIAIMFVRYLLLTADVTTLVKLLKTVWIQILLISVLVLLLLLVTESETSGV